MVDVEVGILELMEEKCNCGPDELVLLIQFLNYTFKSNYAIGAL